MTKDELRKEIRTQRPHWTHEEYLRASSEVIAALTQYPGWGCWHTVMLYSSLPSEPYTKDIINTLYSQGLHVLLPKVLNDTQMEFRMYQGEAHSHTGSFGITEPTTPKVNKFDDVQLIIIPGMAFDKQGYRLGRGKGYYDRFLSTLPKHITKLGICFDYQLRKTIPHDNYDMRMDAVISGNHLIVV